MKKIIPRRLFKALQPAYHFLLSWFSAVWCGRPSERLIVIGVTGTTGKTTVVYLLARMLASAGFKAGFTSTAAFNDGAREWLNDKKMTMPGRFFTQKMLRRMAENGCHYAIVETTSEGIVQFRHRFINYDTLVFTGLYPEHIEAHGSFARYKRAKGRLFSHLKRCESKYVDERNKVVRAASSLKRIELKKIKKAIIANGDDEHAEYFLNFWSERKFIYTGGRGRRLPETKAETVKLEDIEIGAGGTSFRLNGLSIESQLLGDFNAYNIAAAACVCLSEDLAPAAVKRGAESIDGIPGKLEKIEEGQDFTVIVDYAFEPKAVSKLYDVTKLIAHGKIIHVLGSAGGGRDTARRPVLGAMAGERADYVVVTNEDPYDDDPEAIAKQVAAGALKAGKRESVDLFTVLDRRQAIRKAIELAEEKDLVLITGKGSEQAICAAGGEKIPWDDREIARDLLKNMLISRKEGADSL